LFKPSKEITALLQMNQQLFLGNLTFLESVDDTHGDTLAALIAEIK